jgi:hypothetical protein
VVYIRNPLYHRTGAKRRARAKYTESSDPMIEAGAPSTVGPVQGVLRTEGSHGLTTNGPAQPFKGAKRRAALLKTEGEDGVHGRRNMGDGNGAGKCFEQGKMCWNSRRPVRTLDAPPSIKNLPSVCGGAGRQVSASFFPLPCCNPLTPTLHATTTLH